MFYVINRGHISANQSMSTRRGFRIIALKYNLSISWASFIHIKGMYVK